MFKLVLAVFVLALIFSVLFRCILFNLHNIGIYGIRDTIDYFKNHRWEDFNYFGIDMYVAMFGHGKTLSMTHKARLLYAKYGDSITFISNYRLNGIPYIPLTNFNQLVDLGEEYMEGKKGTVVLIDEISSVLSHRNYSNFTLELIGLLCQQRKKRVYIMCTAQRFFMVDKIWRALCTHVIDCNKIWRFQHNSCYDAWDYEQAINSRMIRRIGHTWWFVKNEDYLSYDTSEMVSKNKATDFISNEESIIRKGFDTGLVSNELGISKPSRKFKKRMKGKG